MKWSGRRISQSRPPVPQTGALLPELRPVEIGVSDGTCIRIGETHNLGHYWLCYTHHESGRAPRFCPECLLVPGQADFYLPRAREMRMVCSELPSQAFPPKFSIAGERDRTRTESLPTPTINHRDRMASGLPRLHARKWLRRLDSNQRRPFGSFWLMRPES